VEESDPVSAPAAVATIRPRAQKGVLAFLAALALGMLVHFPIFFSSPTNQDEATVGSLAQGLLRGGHLYTNLVDRKPPLLFYAYALTFWSTHSNSLIPMRVITIALEAATGVVIGVAMCKAWRHRMAVAGIFVLATATFPYSDAHAAGFEPVMLLPITLAWWWSRKGMAIPAALALAVAILIKQPAAFTFVPVAYNLWRRPDGLRAVATMTATAALTCLGVGWLFGLHQFLFWNISGNTSYLGVYSVIPTLGIAALATSVYAASHVVMVWLAAKAWPEWRTQVDLWLWLASALLGVAVAGHFFGHYFFQVLPPLAAIGATQIAKVNLQRTLAVAGATTAVWLVGITILPKPDLPAYGAVVQTVDRLSKPNQPVFVWGSYSEITWASQRPMATRFPHTNFVTGIDQGQPTGGALHAMCSDLDRTKPTLVVDTSPADLRDANKVPLLSVQPLAEMMSSYEPVADVGGVMIYRLDKDWVGC
jgi:hypothetical protein